MIQITRISLFLVVFLTGNARKSETYEDQAFGRILWVIDGDTYQVSHAGVPDGEPVRARHFDTPEKGDHARCEAERIKAMQATEAARRLLPRGAVVLLSDFGRDRYGRLLAAVSLSDGRDLATVMIGAGLAVPYEGGKKSSWCQPFRRRYDRKAKGRSAPRADKTNRSVAKHSPPQRRQAGGGDGVSAVRFVLSLLPPISRRGKGSPLKRQATPLGASSEYLP